MSDRHVVALPGFVTIIRIVQVVLSIVILGLAANTIHGVNPNNRSLGSFSTDSLSFVVFCVVWTWLATAYLILAPLLFPVAYNMWAHLAIEILSWIFWLSGFASAAAWASTWSDYFNVDGIPKKVFSYWATAAAAAGLGAIEWILFTVTLVFFALRLHAHRTDPANANMSGLGFAEKGEGHQMGAIPPQQVVGGQPVQQQHVYPESTAPTPVQYVNTPPPQQWQQSPPPPQQY